MTEEASSDKKGTEVNLATIPQFHILGMETGGRLELRYVRPNGQRSSEADAPRETGYFGDMGSTPERLVAHEISIGQLSSELHQHIHHHTYQYTNIHNGPQTNISGDVKGPVLSGCFDGPVSVHSRS